MYTFFNEIYAQMWEPFLEWSFLECLHIQQNE